jgi:hypothetical protein
MAEHNGNRMSERVVLCPLANFYKGACTGNCQVAGDSCRHTQMPWSEACLLPPTHPVIIAQRGYVAQRPR